MRRRRPCLRVLSSVACGRFTIIRCSIEAFAERVQAASPKLDEEVIFTAHSLPQRVAQSGDPYPDEVAATAKLVAAQSGVGPYLRAYQSAGRTPEPWLGPDLSELIRARAGAGVKKFLIVPIGFVCDHTEILFDIDVQAAEAAREAGVALRRTESLNTSPTFIKALAALVTEAVGRTVGRDFSRAKQDRRRCASTS